MGTKFESLDDAILAAIKAGKTNFSRIVAMVEEVSRPLATVDRSGRLRHDRVVDRRLQALRKQRKIAYASGQWSIVS